MSKTKQITLSFILLFSVFLTGCSSMNSKFDCPNKPGVTCRSIDQVNDMVDRGVIGRDISIRNIHTSKFYSIYPIKNNSNTASAFNPTNLSPSPLRSGEQVVRVWVAPYQDVNSNYHNESTIYTIVHKSNWAAPKEIAE